MDFHAFSCRPIVLNFRHQKLHGSKCRNSIQSGRSVKWIGCMEWLLVVGIALLSLFLGIAITLIALEYDKFQAEAPSPGQKFSPDIDMSPVLPPSPPPPPPVRPMPGPSDHEQGKADVSCQAEHQDPSKFEVSVPNEAPKIPSEKVGATIVPHEETSRHCQLAETPSLYTSLPFAPEASSRLEVAMEIPPWTGRQTLPQSAPNARDLRSLHWHIIPTQNIGRTQVLQTLPFPAQALPLEQHGVPLQGQFPCVFLPRETTPQLCQGQFTITDSCSLQQTRQQQCETPLKIPKLPKPVVIAKISGTGTTVPSFPCNMYHENLQQLAEISQQPRCQRREPAQTQTAPPIFKTQQTLKNLKTTAARNPCEVGLELPRRCKPVGPGPTLPLAEQLQLHPPEMSSQRRQLRETKSSDFLSPFPHLNSAQKPRIIRRGSTHPSLSFAVPGLVPAIDFQSCQRPIAPLPTTLPTFNPQAPQVGRFEVEPIERPDFGQMTSRSLALPATMTAPAWPMPANLPAQRFWCSDVQALPDTRVQGTVVHPNASHVGNIPKLPILYQKVRQIAYRQAPVVRGTKEPFNPDANIVRRINISPEMQNEWPKPLVPPLEPLPTEVASPLKHRRTRRSLRRPMAKVLRPRVPHVPKSRSRKPVKLPVKPIKLPVKLPVKPIPLPKVPEGEVCEACEGCEASSPTASPASSCSPSGYLTSTLGGPFWGKGASLKRRKQEDTPGPGDYSPEHPGIRGRIPGRVPGFPEQTNAARCNEPLGVLLPLHVASRPKSAGARQDQPCQATNSRRSDGSKRPKCPQRSLFGSKILRLNEPTVISYYPWSPGRRKF